MNACDSEQSHSVDCAGSISRLASAVEHSFLEPLSFFVSWQGVLTLAYKGFSPALAQLKQCVTQECPELPKENPGSKWPKTSLGALRNNKRLTPQQLVDLNKICRSFQGALQAEAERVLVSHLTLIMYKCRSLERCLERILISLNPSLCVDQAPASQSEQDNVHAVLQEADEPDYWVSASKDGNRESHYRGAALGCTLVADLFPGAISDHQNHGLGNSRLLQLITMFQEDVDKAMPGMYSWFDHSSLHVTIRALMG